MTKPLTPSTGEGVAHLRLPLPPPVKRLFFYDAIKTPPQSGMIVILVGKYITMTIIPPSYDPPIIITCSSRHTDLSQLDVKGRLMKDQGANVASHVMDPAVLNMCYKP